MSLESQEIADLQTLINDFPAIFSGNQASFAFQLSKQNYEALFGDEELHSKFTDIKAADLKSFHKFIFDQILSNAGEFRKETDRNGGKIFYGGYKGNEHKHKHEGFKPIGLESHVSQACKFLDFTISDLNKVKENAIRFYQYFLRSHPFYDGNGRVARIAIKIYLSKHDLYINWKALNDKRAKLFKKLSKVHNFHLEDKYMDSFKIEQKEEYLNYLIKFMSNYIVETKY